MNISLVTDEVSADPETAFELGIQWGIRNFELRGFYEQRVPLLSSFQQQRLRELIDEFDVRIVAISPGLFKCPWPSGKRERFPVRFMDFSMYQRWQDARSLVQYHQQELLPASLTFAQELRVSKVIIFSFHRGAQPPGPAPDEILLALDEAVQEAEKVGIRLCIEVEDQYWGDTGRWAADLLNRINRPALGINWDPGNAFVAGEVPFPVGYQAVRPYIQHVHYKDVQRLSPGHYQYVVHGQIDWSGQIQALQKDEYQGYISVETHRSPKVRSAQESIQRLKAFIENVDQEE